VDRATHCCRLLLPCLHAALALLCGPVRAQDDPTRHWRPAELAIHLRAEEPTEVAWAAWRAGEDGRRDLVRPLRAALARLAGQDDCEGQLVRLYVLDAMLRLDARVPGEELLPHAVGMLRAPALLLAANTPLANTAYFRARFDDEGQDLEWQACGNLLAAQNAPGFAAACLAHCELELSVDVRDAADDLFCGGFTTH